MNEKNYSSNNTNESKKDSTWTNLELYTNMVLHVSEKTALVAMPFKSEFKGYCFNHPARLVRKTKNPHLVNLSFSEEFVFNIFKRERNEDGIYVQVDERNLSAEEMRKILEPVDADIKAFRQKKKESVETVENDVL